MGFMRLFNINIATNILKVIREKGPITPHDIKENLNIPQSTWDDNQRWLKHLKLIEKRGRKYFINPSGTSFFFNEESRPLIFVKASCFAAPKFDIDAKLRKASIKPTPLSVFASYFFSALCTVYDHNIVTVNDFLPKLSGLLDKENEETIVKMGGHRLNEAFEARLNKFGLKYRVGELDVKFFLSALKQCHVIQDFKSVNNEFHIFGFKKYSIDRTLEDAENLTIVNHILSWHLPSVVKYEEYEHGNKWFDFRQIFNVCVDLFPLSPKILWRLLGKLSGQHLKNQSRAYYLIVRDYEGMPVKMAIKEE